MSPSTTGRALIRTNHAGREVTLLEGVAVGGGAAILLALRSLPVDALTIGAIGGLGLADDVLEPALRERGIAPSKGLRGHLGALRRGRLTTGAAKVLGIPVLCLFASAASARRSARTAAEVIVDAGIAAGAANLANLLDLRPGRALKVIVPVSVLLLGPAADAPSPEGRTLAGIGAVLGIAALPADLGERGMLGDTGANALGALVGGAAARRLPLGARVLALGGLAALTIASERVSFSAVIESRSLLRRLDRWGRRSAPGEERA